MKKSLRIYIYGLIALFSMSTVGVTVYKHYCSHDGIFYRVFVDVEHKCGPTDFNEIEYECVPTNLELEQQHECCTIKTNGSEEFHDNCCTEDVAFYQISSDLITHNSNFDFKLFSSFAFVNQLFVIPQVSEYQELAVANSPPIFFETLERLAQLQIYLI